MRILKPGNKLRQRPPEFANIFGGLGKIVGEIDLGFFHAPQLVNRQLKTILIFIDQTLDFEKIILLEEWR